MATITTHTLNSVDGSHAGGVKTALFRLQPEGASDLMFEGQTDAGGRLEIRLDPGRVDASASYELVLQSGAYFEARRQAGTGLRIVRETVVRFVMPDADARYHIPFMLAPNSHSVWFSS